VLVLGGEVGAVTEVEIRDSVAGLARVGVHHGPELGASVVKTVELLQGK
jgi:hypothetical protein